VAVFADVVSWGLSMGAVICLAVALVRLTRRPHPGNDSDLGKHWPDRTDFICVAIYGNL